LITVRPVEESIRARISRRVRRAAERALLRIMGRPLICAVCGRQLFVAVPIVWRGEIWIIGASEHDVRVAFSGKEGLEFRHLELDECASPDRPWVP
jgi:hypothetical protein